MRASGGRIRPLHAVVAIAVLTLAGSWTLGATARADSIETETLDDSINRFMTYSTSGSIDPIDNGPNVVSFSSVSDSSFTAPSSFSLGEFVTAPLPDGASVSYDDVPFQITLRPTDAVDDITLTGVLNGSITGASQNDITATFDAQEPIAFETVDGAQNLLTVLDTSLSLVPSTTNRGRTTAQARVVVTAIPEPATVAIFVAALVGVGLRRRIQSQRAAATAN